MGFSETSKSIGIYTNTLIWYETINLQHDFLFIAKDVSIFEQDLCQLVKRLKELTFLDIYGAISCTKAQAYLLMAQTHFSHGHIGVELTRFHLWL